MIQGCLFSIIFMIIGNIKIALLLKSCRIDSETFTGETFEYKGKTYDRKKYISERKDMLCDLKDNQLIESLETAKRYISKGKYIGYYQAEADAICDLLCIPRSSNSSNKVSKSTPPEPVSTYTKVLASESQPIKTVNPTTENGELFCIYCGTQLPSDGLFCYKCGKEVISSTNLSVQEIFAAESILIDSKEPVSTSPVIQPVTEQLHVDTTENADTADISLSASPKSNIAPTKKKSRLKWILIPICILSLIAVALGALTYYNQSLYQSGVDAMDNRNFTEAMAYFDKVFADDPFIPDTFAGEYAYVEAGTLYEAGEYVASLNALDKITSTGTYDVPKSVLVLIKSNVYKEAQSLYREFDYVNARPLFMALNGFKRSNDYLTLINVHFAIPMSLIVNYYDELVSLIGFEDAGKLLLYDNVTAPRFLAGTWEGNGHILQWDNNGFIFSLPYSELLLGQYREWNVFFNYGLVSIGDSKTQMSSAFYITVISEDQIEVFCYADGSKYTLYRQ